MGLLQHHLNLDDDPSPAPFHDLDPETAQQLVRLAANELLVLDVRSEAEHASHRIPGCKLIPIHEITVRHEELDPDRPILVYCEHGIRSVEAAGLLASLGFQEVFNLRGGIATWTGPREQGSP